MLFNSYLFFLLFVPATAIGYRLIFRAGANARIAWLAVTSLLFYAASDFANLPVLLLSIAFNFGAGTLLTGQSDAVTRKRWLAAAITANVAVLAAFKYTDPLSGMAGLLGFSPVTHEKSGLPLGISFFTFTQIAFLFDCARGEVKRTRMVDYGVFVAWFPHLTAGPLLAHKRFLPQLRGATVRCPDGIDYSVGLTFLAIGMFKKMVLADSLGPFADHLLRDLGSGAAHGAISAWTGSIAYILVIYFDFSGYSDMAMGISRLFGIDLPVNFYSPFRARNPSDFWRRWHRTLSWFIRSYVHSPLAGRQSGYRPYLRLLLIMAGVGLWHGSTWNFVLFGLYHGVLLVIHNIWRIRLGHRPNRDGRSLADFGARAATFVAVTASAGLFFYQDVANLRRFYGNLLGLAGKGPLLAFSIHQEILVVIGLATVWLLPNSAELLRAYLPKWALLQLPRDRGLIALTWRPSARWAFAFGAALAIALASIPQSVDIVYRAF